MLQNSTSQSNKQTEVTSASHLDQNQRQKDYAVFNNDDQNGYGNDMKRGDGFNLKMFDQQYGVKSKQLDQRITQLNQLQEQAFSSQIQESTQIGDMNSYNGGLKRDVIADQITQVDQAYYKQREQAQKSDKSIQQSNKTELDKLMLLDSQTRIELNQRLSDYIKQRINQAVLEESASQNHFRHSEGNRDSAKPIQNDKQVDSQQSTRIDRDSHGNAYSSTFNSKEIEADQSLRKVVQKLKHNFYSREEANDLMEEEREQRRSRSRERSNLVRQRIIEKEHSILTQEIIQGKILKNDHQVQQFERDYKNQLFKSVTARCQSDDEFIPEDSEKLNQLYSNQVEFQANQEPNFQKFDQVTEANQSMQRLNPCLIVVRSRKIDSQRQSPNQSHKQQSQHIAFDTNNTQSNYSTQFSQKQASKKTSPSKPLTSPQSKISPRVLQNSSNQVKEQRMFPQASISKITPSKKSPQKNNFLKSTQEKEKEIRLQNSNRVKENLQMDMQEAVESYDTTTSQRQLSSQQSSRLTERSNEKPRNEHSNQMLTSIKEEQIEDMILNLHRLTQKSKGIIPAEHQAKLQQFMNKLETEKLTYSKRVSSSSAKKSPGLNKDENQNQRAERVPLNNFSQGASTNVNSKILKNIIKNTGSKVREVIMSSGKNSQRTSQERQHSFTQVNLQNNIISHGNLEVEKQLTAFQIFEIETIDETKEMIRGRSDDQLKQDLQLLLSGISSRQLSQLFRSRGQQPVSSVEYEIGYMMALIVSIVDDKVVLSNDKSDLLGKTWDDICKSLSNHGRVVYSLQKLRIVVEKPANILKQFNKLQIHKKFNERRDLFFNSTSDSNHAVILKFISDLLDIVKYIQQKHQSLQNEKPKQRKAVPYSKEQDSKAFISPLTTQREKQKVESHNFISQTYRNSPNKFEKKIDNSNSPQRVARTGKHSKNNSISRAINSNLNGNQDSASKVSIQLSTLNREHQRAPSLQQQLISQKQHAVAKSYQLQLDQSMSFRMKSDQARAKELQMAQLKMQQKALMFQLDKQERLRVEQEQRESELKYIQEQANFNSYKSSAQKDQKERERLVKREASLENSEFKRAVRFKELEEQLKSHREENQKSMQEYLFNQFAKQQQLQQDREICQRRHQELLIEKVRESESFLSLKESDLDERLRSQFDQAQARFRRLDEGEKYIKRELETLNKLMSNTSRVGSLTSRQNPHTTKNADIKSRL